MPDDVYERYMQALRDWRQHRDACAHCPTGYLCQAGTQLLERLARLQDAYLTRLKNRR